MNDLDTLLRDALTTDAERAPDLPDEWVGPTTATIVAIEPRRRTRQVWVGVGSVAAVAAAIGGLALVARPDSAPAPAASTAPPPPAWQPPGEEFPLTDLGPAAESPGGPVPVGLTRRIGIPGHPEQIVAPSLSYTIGGATAEVLFCTWENGGGGCRPEWNPATWSFSVTSSVDNGDADFDLLTIEGLPAEAAYVGYVDGETSNWQRPIAGFAAFPNVPGESEVLTTWDAAGVQLATYDQRSYFALASRAVRPANVDLTQAQFDEVHDLTRSSMATCLTGRGGDLNAGGVATFADGVDQIAVWDDCVVEVKAIVAQRVAELT